MKDTLIDTVLRKALAVGDRIKRRFPDSALAEKIEILSHRRDAHRVRKLIHAFTAPDLVAATRLCRKREIDKSKLWYWDVWRDVKRDLEEAIKARMIVEYVSGLDHLLAFYRRLPDDFPGMRERIREIYRYYGIRALPQGLSREEEKKAIAERFKDYPDILAECRYEDNYIRWTDEEEVAFLLRTARSTDRLSVFARKDIVRYSAEHQQKLKPYFFAAYRKYNTDQIIKNIASLQDEFFALPPREQEVIIDHYLEARDYLSFSATFKFLIQVNLNSEQRKLFFTSIARHASECRDFLVNELLLVPENCERLSVSREKVFDILIREAPWSLASRLTEVQFTPHERQRWVEEMIANYAGKFFSEHFEKAKEFLNEDEWERLLDKVISSSPALVASRLSDLTLTRKQKENLVVSLMEENQPALLDHLDALKLSTDEIQQLINWFVHKNPILLLQKYCERKVVLTLEQESAAIDNAIAAQPITLLNYVNPTHPHGLRLREEQARRLARECYHFYFKNGNFHNLEVVFWNTRVPVELDQQLSETITRALLGIAPSEYHRVKAIIQRVCPPDEKIDIPWGPVYDRLLEIQGRAARREYDPWRTDLDPLVKVLVEKKILSPESAQDGEILVSFVDEYGMYNLPTIFRWHAAIKRAGAIQDIPLDVRQEIESSLKINLERHSNKGFVTHEIKKFRQRVQAELLNDHIPKEIIESDAGFELFLAFKGVTRWKRLVDPREIIKTWERTATLNPELAALPAGYAEVSFEVPVKAQREETAAEKTRREETRNAIIGNPELLLALGRLRHAYTRAFSFADIRKWWPETKQGTIEFIDAAISVLKERSSRESNERAQAHMERTIAALERAREGITTLDNLLQLPYAQKHRDAEIVAFMEALAQALPENLKQQRDTVLREISALHSLCIMPENQKEILREMTKRTTLGETDVTAWRNHLVDYMNEHYLHEQQEEHRTGHVPFSTKLLRELQFLWGLKPNIKNNIVVQADAKLRALEEIGLVALEEKLSVSLVPARGILRIFSGDVGDACYTSQYKELARGEYPRLTAFIFVTGRGTPNERLRGSLLAIETKTADGEPVLLIRANNPQENLLGQVDVNTFLSKVIEEMKKLAKRRDITKVVVSQDSASGSSSNRPAVSSYYKTRGGTDKIELVNEPETNFNGYPNWNSKGIHAVVEI